MAATLQTEVLARLRAEGGATFVADLAALLARTVPARLAQMSHGLATDDRAVVRLATHSLRSAAANFGAAELAEAAGALENLADSAEVWPDAQARTAAAARVSAAWADVSDRVRALAATRVEPG
jgi:HPt (histidine-containing phosphotransfer) domain-containing protein